MDKIAGKKVYKLKDVVAALAPMRHKSEAETAHPRYYSYGGVRALMEKKFPDLRPTPHGTYLLVENIPAAVAAMNSRMRAPERAWTATTTLSMAGLEVISLALFARGLEMSLSNVRKVLYEDTSPIYPHFFEWGGGFALTQAQYRELLRWIPRVGNGPRPTRFRKSAHKKRGGKLNYERVMLAHNPPAEPEEEETL